MALAECVGADRTWETAVTVGSSGAVKKLWSYTSRATRMPHCTTSTGDFGMSYQVTTKKNLIIFHNTEDWAQVLDRLAEDFGTAIRMRHIMRRELGFTARDHAQWSPKMDGGYYGNQIHLDFYNEAAQSWFVLKYL